METLPSAILKLKLNDAGRASLMDEKPSAPHFSHRNTKLTNSLCPRKTSAPDVTLRFRRRPPRKASRFASWPAAATFSCKLPATFVAILRAWGGISIPWRRGALFGIEERRKLADVAGRAPATLRPSELDAIANRVKVSARRSLGSRGKASDSTSGVRAASRRERQARERRFVLGNTERSGSRRPAAGET